MNFNDELIESNSKPEDETNGTDNTSYEPTEDIIKEEKAEPTSETESISILNADAVQNEEITFLQEENTQAESDAIPVIETHNHTVSEEEVITDVINESELVVAEDAPDLNADIKEEIADIESIEDEIEEEDVDYDTLNREELVDALEKIVLQKAVDKIKRKIGLIKISYIKQTKEEKEKQLNEFLAVEGNKKEDFKTTLDILEERFNNAFDIYKKNKKTFDESIEKERKENLEKKKNILEEIKRLIESEDELKITYDSFRKLQAEWKEIGQVAHNETNELWRSYHFLVEKFLDKVRINEELRDLDRKKNLEQAIELCEKTEELLLNPSINQSYKLLQQFHDDWKDIGALPQDKKEEVWYRFRQASIKVNERRKEYFEKVKAEQHNNFIAKTVLCEKIEEIVDKNFNNSKEWQEATDKIIEIQNLWKTIGNVSDENKDLVWKRFRAAINLFFDNKKEHFDGIKEEFLNNYNLKLDICNQAEALKVSQDWKKTTNEIIKLQNDWKKIGTLPKKQSDDLWRKFRAACDYFFEKKQEYFNNIDDKEKENLSLKLALIEKVKNTPIEGDKKNVFDVVKEYQREFTALGHVPVNEKEKVQNLFRDAINQKLDDLKINPVERKIMTYKSKFEQLKNEPKNNDVIRNEIRFISNKISQLNTDIQLWENNIGFFANSKSANILKQEFENKIENAKEEIKVLEGKLKFLKSN